MKNIKLLDGNFYNRNKILEKMIQKNPAQWIWSHGRWK